MWLTMLSLATNFTLWSCASPTFVCKAVSSSPLIVVSVLHRYWTVFVIDGVHPLILNAVSGSPPNAARHAGYCFFGSSYTQKRPKVRRFSSACSLATTESVAAKNGLFESSRLWSALRIVAAPVKRSTVGERVKQLKLKEIKFKFFIHCFELSSLIIVLVFVFRNWGAAELSSPRLVRS